MMRVISLIVHELIGMFVDDEFLAVAVLAVVALAAGLAFLPSISPLLVGATLLCGCVAILMSSVLRAVHKNL
jgi:apolipoprotein N-acyltransferase